FRERRASMHRQIALASYQASTDLKQREDVVRKVQSLVAEDQQLEARLRESAAIQELGAQPLASLAELKEFLARDSALLEYHLGEEGSYLWLVRQTGVTAFRLPSRAAIEREIALAAGLFSKFNERRNDPAKQRAFQAAMDRLARILLGPVGQG